MNDVHDPTDADQWNVPPIRREHPDCIVAPEEARQGKGGWMAYCMDYSRPDVRQYMLELIGEQIDLYGQTLDVFQLDWMRFPRHLSGTPDEIWEKRQILTEFVAQVRRLLGGHTRLAARVPPTPAGCRHLGFDLPEWVRLGLVDWLVACPFLTTVWQVPIEEFRRWLPTRIPLYAGFDFGFGQQIHCPESLRGACSSLYAVGADGVYLFNFPCWIEYLGARPFHWLAGLDAPETAAAKPLLLAAEHRRHRVPGVDPEGHLPAPLPPGTSLEISLNIPPRALPAWRALCLLRTGGDVALAVNGAAATPVLLGHPPRQAHRSELFAEFTDQYHNPKGRPAPDECRLFRLPVEALRPGANAFCIDSRAAAPLEIERLNLGLW